MRKILLAVGALVIVIILIVVVKSLNKDEVTPQLATILRTESLVVNASQDATNRASTFELQTQAANLATVVISNQAQLTRFYQKHVSKKLPTTTGSTGLKTVEKLKTDPVGETYDQSYLSLVKALLKANLGSLKFIYTKTKNTELRDLADQIYKNQATLYNDLP